MVSPPKCELLEFPENIIDTIRTLFGIGEPGKCDEILDNLQDWIKSQNHFLKKEFNKYYLETCLITCKGDLERAKQRFEKLCTLKTLLPDYFDTYNVKDLKGLKEIHGGVLPKLDKNNNRIAIFRDDGAEFNSDFFKTFFKQQVILAEYLRNYDYSDGYQVIFDASKANLMNIVSAINIVELRHFLILMIEGYGLKLNGLHIVISPGTAATATDMILSIVKSVVSDKLGERIRICQSLDAVYEQVEKDLLPAEYGGKEISLKELSAKWMDVLSSQQHIDFMKEISGAKIEAASTEALMEQHLGTSVNFRKLELD